MPDDLKESLGFFEQLLKESYGEAKFKRAVQIIEEFQGDIFSERNEKKLISKLVKEIFKTSESEAQNFLHECSSYLLMRLGSQGFAGKHIGLLTV
jgi:hypothetical protein